MIILGIDPGLTITGFGGILCKSASPSLLTCGSIKTAPPQLEMVFLNLYRPFTCAIVEICEPTET